MAAESMAYLDDEERVISSALWRSVCGSPSNNSWQKYRKSIGLPSDNRKHKLTRKEAYLLLVRSKLRPICDKLNIQKPKDSEMESYSPDSPLFAVATAYADTLPAGGLTAILKSAVNSSNLSGEAVLALLATIGEVANRNLGERQVKRMISQAGLGAILKRRIYPYAQIRNFIDAISIALSEPHPKPHRTR